MQAVFLDNFNIPAGGSGYKTVIPSFGHAKFGFKSFFLWKGTLLILNNIVLFCPSGQAAGTGHGKDRTGGSPFICVPSQPWYFGQVDPSTPLGNVSQVNLDALKQDQTRSTLHGTYFYLSCVLCLVRRRSVQIMLPARKECYRGWHREYDGYLAVQSNRKDHKDVICIDRESRGLLQDATYVRGLFASCQTFSCPPYVETERLPCVVCTI